MKTLQEIKQFYESELLADLTALDQKRRKVLQKLTYVGITLLCMVGIIVFIVLRNPHAYRGIIIVPVVLSLIIAAIAYFFIGKGYITEFKVLVIDRIVHFIDEQLLFHTVYCRLICFAIIDHIIDHSHELITCFSSLVAVIIPEPGCYQDIGMVLDFLKINLFDNFSGFCFHFPSC